MSVTPNTGANRELLADASQHVERFLAIEPGSIPETVHVISSNDIYYDLFGMGELYIGMSPVTSRLIEKGPNSFTSGERDLVLLMANSCLSHLNSLLYDETGTSASRCGMTVNELADFCRPLAGCLRAVLRWPARLFAEADSWDESKAASHRRDFYRHGRNVYEPIYKRVQAAAPLVSGNEATVAEALKAMGAGHWMPSQAWHGDDMEALDLFERLGWGEDTYYFEAKERSRQAEDRFWGVPDSNSVDQGEETDDLSPLYMLPRAEERDAVGQGRDGPQADNKTFRFRSETITLTRKPFRVMSYLWKHLTADEDVVALDSLVEYVNQGSGDGEPDEVTLRGWAHEASKNLKRLRCDWRVAYDGTSRVMKRATQS